jgi:hypothetical protein
MLGMLLYVAVGIAGPDEMEWTAPSARIPIEYIPTRKGEIRQLLLYVSSDRGGTWTQHSTAQPGQAHFSFSAKKDGPHWFVLVIEGSNGDRSPPDVTKAEPGLKMYFRIPTEKYRIPKAKD